MSALLDVKGVSKSYGKGSGRVHALRDVDLTVAEGERVGLIGASGAGKSTLARLVAGLETPDRGSIRLDGQDVAKARGRARRAMSLRRHLVFQDAYAALPSRRRVGDLVAEPLVIHRLARGEALEDQVRQALSDVELTPPERFMGRRPGELSGGQRQRVALARAVIARPGLILADEPTSMLDAPVRAGLLATLAGLSAKHGAAVLLITHDLALAASFCERLAVVDAGRIVEQAPSAELWARPRHAGTRRLRSAARELRGLG